MGTLLRPFNSFHDINLAIEMQLNNVYNNSVSYSKVIDYWQVLPISLSYLYNRRNRKRHSQKSYQSSLIKIEHIFI